MIIFGFEITRVKQAPSTTRSIVRQKPGPPAPLTEEQLLFETLMIHHCPNCGSNDGFLEGPRGGISVNVMCANPSCCAKFNVTPALEIAERI